MIKLDDEQLVLEYVEHPAYVCGISRKTAPIPFEGDAVICCVPTFRRYAFWVSSCDIRGRLV